MGAGRGGQDRQIELVLKLIADVGLVGEPNAGKSTLLSVCRPPGPRSPTTPSPRSSRTWAWCALSGHRTFVVADIPGIIEGAHDGKGLGLQFLQHVERTRVLAFLVPLDSPDPQAVYERLRRGGPALQRDAGRDAARAAAHQAGPAARRAIRCRWCEAPDAAGILAVSSAAGTGLEELKEFLWKFVEEAKRAEATARGGTAEVPGYWEFMDDE